MSILSQHEVSWCLTGHTVLYINCIISESSVSGSPKGELTLNGNTVEKETHKGTLHLILGEITSYGLLQTSQLWEQCKSLGISLIRECAGRKTCRIHLEAKLECEIPKGLSASIHSHSLTRLDSFRGN